MYLEVIAVLPYNKHDAVFHACVLRTYRPVTRFQYLVGHKTFLWGQDFCFTACLKQVFLGATKFGGNKRNFFGDTAAECSPVATGLRTYPRVLSCICVYLVTAMHVWSPAPCVLRWRRYTIKYGWCEKRQSYVWFFLYITKFKFLSKRLNARPWLMGGARPKQLFRSRPTGVNEVGDRWPQGCLRATCLVRCRNTSTMPLLLKNVA